MVLYCVLAEGWEGRVLRRSMVRAWSPYAGVSVSAWNATPLRCQAQWALQLRASAHDARDDAARRGRGGGAGVFDGRAPEQSPSTLAPTSKEAYGLPNSLI